MGKHYAQLNQFERDRIQALLDAKTSQKEIAKVLDRSASSVSRELKRNRLQKDGLRKKGEYSATTAGRKARIRRQYARYQGKKIEGNGALKRHIIAGLEAGHSPDAVSGRMKLDGKPFYAGKTAIYSWLYSVWGQRYCHLLCSRKSRKRKRTGKKTEREMIPDRIGIEKRPEGASRRSECGHWEGDTIVSGRKTGSKAALAVLYERKEKLVRIRKVPSLSPAHFNEAARSALEGHVAKTLTLDNGIENRHHGELGIDTYFCDAYSSWQKGGVENANRLIRRFIPKGSDISQYSDEYVKMVEDILNNKPRKSLGYKTAIEAAKEHGLFIAGKEKPEAQKIALRGGIHVYCM